MQFFFPFFLPLQSVEKVCLTHSSAPTSLLRGKKHFFFILKGGGERNNKNESSSLLSVIAFQGAQSCSDATRFVLCHGWFCVKWAANERSNCLFSCRNSHRLVPPTASVVFGFFFPPLGFPICILVSVLESGVKRWIAMAAASSSPASC